MKSPRPEDDTVEGRRCLLLKAWGTFYFFSRTIGVGEPLERLAAPRPSPILCEGSEEKMEETYAIKYKCTNCGKEIVKEFPKGTHTPRRLEDEKCPYCGCKGFTWPKIIEN